ncbi:MAG: shikimate kinase [Euryarchaeota archaeon]|nr:shikimate kinase [Euryarchaeota archaeon]
MTETPLLPRPLRFSTGRARSHGAVTVVNAIATGHGAAIGIDLATDATVTLAPADKTRIDVAIEDEPSEPTALAEACVRQVLERLGIEEPIHAVVKTRSTIPVSRGLKSSSAAANAIVLATLTACGQTVGDGEEDVMDDQAAVRLGVDAALAARVTITGAFDDAAASWFGGLVATDNPDRRIVHQEDVGDLELLLVVPPRKVRTIDTMTAPTHPLRPLVAEAHALVREGKWQEAMLRNSLAYGGSYGLSNRLVIHMLDTGAIAAGISGTGPAVAVVIRRDDWDCFTGIVGMLEPDARVLVAHTNRKKAQVLEDDEPLPEPLVVQEGARHAEEAVT